MTVGSEVNVDAEVLGKQRIVSFLGVDSEFVLGINSLVATGTER